MEASSASYKSYQQWVKNNQLESKLSLQNYSVSNRGLRAGTAKQVQDRVQEFKKVGADFFLLKASRGYSCYYF